MADSRTTEEIDHETAEILTVGDIRSLLTERAEEILRSLGSIPILGPALEEALPVDTRILVITMAPHLNMN